MWYICPQHAVSLRYEGPARNVCPIDGRSYPGWPYDQVIYSRMHDYLAGAARDLGLAYRLTGKSQYALTAAALLRAYADAYSKYPIHDVNNKTATSGARVHAQTLDESIWLIPIAWAYDLIADSPALSGSDRVHIEQDLLRAAAAVVDRNRAGKSNWQSWHNAGVGAVGFALDDPGIAARVLRDPSNSFDHNYGTLSTNLALAPYTALRVNGRSCDFARDGDFILPSECWQIKNRRR